MHHRVHAVFLEQRAHQVAVAHLAHDERRIDHRLAKAARQVIEHHHGLAALAQLQRDVAADVARTTGD